MLKNLRIDWEGSTEYCNRLLYVYADYKWEYDLMGRPRLVVTDYVAYDSSDNIVDLDTGFEEYLAEIIMYDDGPSAA